MDVLHDSSHKTWYQIGNKYATLIPDYAMDMPLLTKEAAATLPDTAFADTVHRRFPVDKQGATFLSAAYYADAKLRQALPTGDYTKLVEANIKRAATIFGITADVDKIMTAVLTEEQDKRADDESNFGYTRDGVKLYPMFDEVGVMKASAYFDEYRFSYPQPMRKEIAENIMTKAAGYGVTVSDIVRREAGQGICNPEVVAAELLDRAKMYKDAETSQVIGAMAKVVAMSSGSDLVEASEKLAAIMGYADAIEGVDASYGRKLLSPADILYDINLKSAQAILEDSVELRRNMFSAVKLAQLPVSVYSDVLGADFAAGISDDKGISVDKLAAELNALPMPDKDALETRLETLYG